MIKLTFDTKLLKQRFDAIGSKQLPFAMALTLTRTAQVMQTHEKIEAKFAFDRPTKFTLESVFIRGATKRNLEAFIFLRDEASKGTPPVKYLAPEVYGGQRRVKRFERALQAAGILGRDEATVPGQLAKLNQYGNITAGTITQILSFLRASPDPMQNRTKDPGRRKRKPKEFFAGHIRKGGRAFGDEGPRAIFQRKGGRAIPILLFVPLADIDYEKKFDFFGIIEQVLDRGELRKQFKLAMREARRTAK